MDSEFQHIVLIKDEIFSRQLWPGCSDPYLRLICNSEVGFSSIKPNHTSLLCVVHKLDAGMLNWDCKSYKMYACKASEGDLCHPACNYHLSHRSFGLLHSVRLSCWTYQSFLFPHITWWTWRSSDCQENKNLAVISGDVKQQEERTKCVRFIENKTENVSVCWR